MSAGHRQNSYAGLVLDRFENWPLTQCRTDHAPGRGLSLRGLQVVHLHREDAAEVFLTTEVIGRLDAVLAASGRAEIFADTGWVEVRLGTDSDLFLLQSLVSLAIQAHGPVSHPTPTMCPSYVRERVHDSA